MRDLFRSARGVVLGFIRTIAGLQGVAGVGCVAGGAVVLWGPGVALLIVGVFLLLGAWGSR